jgi:hypothetical protein
MAWRHEYYPVSVDVLRDALAAAGIDLPAISTSRPPEQPTLSNPRCRLVMCVQTVSSDSSAESTASVETKRTAVSRVFVWYDRED